MAGGPFAFFSNSETNGDYSNVFHNQWGKATGADSANQIFVHELGHVRQSWDMSENIFAPLYPLYAPFLTKYNHQDNPFERQANSIGDINKRLERQKALRAIYEGYKP
ncbi:hypothetical protein [Leptospira licerasiae]|uniref:hypothetical protein n=1 Tax=Leptospira licerasiae TaxID=447106 RepID=UPI001082FE4C|nr:hypothetical protein [Leptospira licerasiae]TGM89381.1 hypothetical protein EHR05_10910 [Leptospira licerasiae]